MLENLGKINTNKSKRVGRGPGSGRGKTAGRGTKGQKSRSGYNIPRRFEGGQTPLTQRLPKVGGFKSRRIKPQVINIEFIDKKFASGDEISLKTLFAKGLISDSKKPIKILGAKFTKNYKFKKVTLNKKLSVLYLKNKETPKPSTVKSITKKSTSQTKSKSVK